MQMDNLGNNHLYPTFDGKAPAYAHIPEESLGCKSHQNEECSKLPNPSLFVNSWDGVDPEIGLTPEEEMRRSEGLANMINLNNYSRDTYHKAFFSVMDMNNAVYNGIYVTIMLVLAATLGLLLSIVMAIVTALIEFTNLFILRPTSKILKIVLDFCVSSPLRQCEVVLTALSNTENPRLLDHQFVVSFLGEGIPWHLQESQGAHVRNSLCSHQPWPVNTKKEAYIQLIVCIFGLSYCNISIFNPCDSLSSCHVLFMLWVAVGVVGVVGVALWLRCGCCVIAF